MDKQEIKEIEDRASKVKSIKVKKYMKPFLHKIESMGSGAGFWLERLEKGFDELQPEGLMKGFDRKDFDDFWFVLTGIRRKEAQDRIAERVALHNIAKELVKVAKCMVAAPRLMGIVQQFEKVQSSITGFGATDSEPNWFFERLMGMAVSGKAFPSVNPGDWQLYESISGWERAADKLTKAAKIAFDAIQNAPHIQVMELAKYYGWKVDLW